MPAGGWQLHGRSGERSGAADGCTLDPVTQGLLGAAIAQALAPRLGRGAIPFGAAVAMSPDLDVVIGAVGGPLAEWQHHRGVTHSLWFGPLVGPAVGYAIWRFLR